MDSSIRIEGLEKVRTAMKRSVDDSKKRRILLKALRYGAVPTRNAMKAGTPIKTGNLKSSIASITGKTTLIAVGARVTKRRRRGKAKRIKNDGYYINWVAEGHKDRGGKMTKAQDFITPAFESTKGIAEKRIVDKLIKEVLEKNW